MSPGQPLVLDGYVLRILTAQGDNALGQAQNYIVNGKMTNGFAILATPVKYAETGIMTFMINREGVVYERDLGADTSEIAAAMRQYDPNGNWSPAPSRIHESSERILGRIGKLSVRLRKTKRLYLELRLH